MTVQQYFDKISIRFKSGISTEHSYRGDLQLLLESLSDGLQVTNEPTRIACGAPDYIITKKDIPIGYIEAKDIGVDLNSKSLKEQFDRYRNSLSNLIITDYIDYHFYVDKEFKTSIRIGHIEGNKLVPNPEKFDEFTTLIKNFCAYRGQTIKSSKKLAEMMAGKAKLLALVIENALNADLNPNATEVHEDANNTLREQLKAFQDILIHDITPKEFADIYSQTIAYGMFAARLHDPDLDTFSRVEAAERIPKTNPFLRKLFQYVAGYDLDSRIQWIVDALADIFRATDVRALISNFGKATKQQDPIIHFYETFLSEYDPKLRKARGVWYTPEPVVNFIVRAVDEILKTEFDLPQGLADSSKTKIKVEVQGKKVEQEVHRVQILDPATGTGTFLAEVIKQIHGKFKGQEGIWSNYVENHLIPRLNGFELLMASYAMAHLKLDLLLTETGFKPTKEQRFRVYLTNSLEEYHPETGTLFANWLSYEDNEDNRIKKDTQLMCVIGNPQYNIVSNNLSDKQRAMVEKYKYINGEKIKEKGALQLEKNLNDDYVKFIALSESFINKNEYGIVAFINNNNFLDAFTLRGMRYNLQETFDMIYILDAHGNYMKKEVSPNGEKDENIFDIQQGVSINIFVKTNKKKKNDLGKVFHYDLYGKREYKYQFLMENSIKSIPFKFLNINKDQFYFVQKDFITLDKYNQGFALDKLFLQNVTGVKTHRDGLVIGFNKNEIKQKITAFYNEEIPLSTIKAELDLKDTGTWNILKARKNGTYKESFFEKIQYRPFDTLNIYYDSNLIDCNRINVMKHFIDNKNNIGLVIPRQAITDNWSHVQVTRSMIDNRMHYSNKGTPICCPLYIYPDFKGQQSIEQTAERKHNLNIEIVNQIADKLGFTFTSEKETIKNSFSPIDIFDYIYAYLHSQLYREKYKEFLKIDFPRVPYPNNKDNFWTLVELGSQLRQIHLLESPKIEQYITKYPISGTNEVDKIKYIECKVYINETQYFEGVPEIAWNFYIGGYQPAQKWLKDRKGRTLNFEDILHYQKIIVALVETDRLMKEIDAVIEF